MSYSNQVFKNTETGQLFDIFTQPQADLIPSKDLTYDLGSSTRRWERLNTNDIVFVNGGSSLDYYKAVSGTLNLSQAGGGYGLNYTATRIGKQITISFTGLIILGASGIGPVVSSTGLPVDFRPSEVQFQPVLGQATGDATITTYLATITSGGIFNFNKLSGTGFSVGNTIEWKNFSMSYNNI